MKRKLEVADRLFLLERLDVGGELRTLTRCPVCGKDLLVKPVGIRRVLENHVGTCADARSLGKAQIAEVRYLSTNAEAIRRARDRKKPGGKLYFVHCSRR